jgi:hypothetical protein
VQKSVFPAFLQIESIETRRSRSSKMQCKCNFVLDKTNSETLANKYMEGKTKSFLPNFLQRSDNPPYKKQDAIYQEKIIQETSSNESRFNSKNQNLRTDNKNVENILNFLQYNSMMMKKIESLLLSQDSNNRANSNIIPDPPTYPNNFHPQQNDFESLLKIANSLNSDNNNSHTNTNNLYSFLR